MQNNGLPKVAPLAHALRSDQLFVQIHGRDPWDKHTFKPVVSGIKSVQQVLSLRISL